ncbi:MAG: arylesterase [Rhodoferax sp.]|uniref:arylesterase n=1 Tax=Rhodoferax sp. TaxID=50421 RepID=UPI002733934D|nr:arylesterase [Rhodoferax sp.]MDP2679818.1 arylesterase [Rhodoferax sp.]
MNFSLQQIPLNRRHCIVLAGILAASGIYGPTGAATVPTEPATPSLLVLGDSLSAEYGLRRGTGWVALLERQLEAEKMKVTVVNASISGDTTSGGRARLPALLAQHRPTLVVIELGGNDALRGLPLDMSRDNLLAMTRLAQQNGAKVALLGMQVPPNYGRDYAQRFARIYVDVAKATRSALVPFFLKGIADVPDSMAWFQADRIHPKEEAHPRLLANVWPTLKKGLQ